MKLPAATEDKEWGKKAAAHGGASELLGEGTASAAHRTPGLQIIRPDYVTRARSDVGEGEGNSIPLAKRIYTPRT